MSNSQKMPMLPQDNEGIKVAQEEKKVEVKKTTPKKTTTKK